jgi:5-methyltetrahydrofolate--homocysteine methyltransferase
MPTTAASKIATFHTLRQQLEKREGRFNAALSDFIAPASSGVPDYVGAFVVTAGIGEDVVADRFKNANDDYSSILCKALADRLAEVLPSGCTSASARNSGATRRTRRLSRTN